MSEIKVDLTPAQARGLREVLLHVDWEWFEGSGMHPKALEAADTAVAKTLDCLREIVKPKGEADGV